MISPLRGLAWIGGSLLVLGIAGGVAFFVFVRPTPLPPAQSPTPRPELSDETGWYRLPNGPCALVTYSAQGGLALASMEDSLFFDRMARASEGEFQWHRATRDTLHVRFLAGEEMRAFAWTAPDEATRQARGCDGPYTVRELNFSSGEVLLSGTAFLPTDTGPHPGTVMIHGSGTSDRDNLWYLQIAHHLAKHGLAVLLPDKRGSGRSGGHWRTAGFVDFARDALAGVDVLAAQPEVDGNRIGLIGVSQGGRVAPLAATMTSDLAFIVNLSGGTTTMNESLEHETVNTLVQKGLPRWLAHLVEPVASAVPKRERPVWWEKNGDFDPMTYWPKVRVPTLVLYGQRDEQDNVPVQRSVQRLETVRRQDAVDVTVRVIEGTGHGFLQSPDRWKIRPDVLKLLTDWIHEQVGQSQK